LAQQLLAAALEQLAAFIDGDRFLERNLAFSSRLTIVSSSSIARSKDSCVTSELLFSA